MMAQQRQFPMVGGGGGGGNYGGQQYSDTTFTKIFVGGLAWETQRDAMRRYFEQFGEILEAVVITDKNTGRSKGYGFVTFRDPESARRACQNPSPIIDGRRANCNLASLGAHKTRPPPPYHGTERFRPATGLMVPPPYHGSSSTYFHQHSGQYTLPYSAYGYTSYSQEAIYPMIFFSFFFFCRIITVFMDVSKFRLTMPQVHQALMGFTTIFIRSIHSMRRVVKHEALEFNFLRCYHIPLPQQYGTMGILSLPTSIPPATTGIVVTTTAGVAGPGPGASQATEPASEQNSST
ncbi:RNA recognition motif domain [Dillenia turbinata]|uniref:RNA recognition motif domain n=1 Tax=Dillenia turbinata TaxID=194707 RepID=A0AAN8UMY2_9MAGN